MLQEEQHDGEEKMVRDSRSVRDSIVSFASHILPSLLSLPSLSLSLVILLLGEKEDKKKKKIKK